jgi:hypothetical protein
MTPSTRATAGFAARRTMPFTLAPSRTDPRFRRHRFRQCPSFPTGNSSGNCCSSRPERVVAGGARPQSRGRPRRGAPGDDRPRDRDRRARSGSCSWDPAPRMTFAPRHGRAGCPSRWRPLLVDEACPSRSSGRSLSGWTHHPISARCATLVGSEPRALPPSPSVSPRTGSIRGDGAGRARTLVRRETQGIFEP